MSIDEFSRTGKTEDCLLGVTQSNDIESNFFDVCLSSEDVCLSSEVVFGLQ